MLTKFEVENIDHLKLGSGVYYEKEYTFEYLIDSDHDLNKGSLLLQCDTLTIAFNPFTKEFLSLDDFTNFKQWEYKEKMEIPLLKYSGNLKIKKGFSDDTRESIRAIPQYEFSSENVFKINMVDDREADFYKITNSLIVDLKEGEITSFIIEKISLVKGAEFHLLNIPTFNDEWIK